MSALALWMLASDARAQQPAPGLDDKPLYFVSGHYGRPLRTSAGFAVFVPAGRQRYPIRSGVLLEGSAGQGGGRVSGGVARFLEYAGFDGRVVLSRTWNRPRAASPASTYGGVEGGITIWYFRASAGVARRIGGGHAPRSTIATWTVAVQVPFAM